MRRFMVCTLSILSILFHSHQSFALEHSWPEFQSLIGEWEAVGEKSSGSGSFSLVPALSGKTLVRRNRMEMPAANGRPAAVREDLMVIFIDPTDKQKKAHYYDNEGHFIFYEITPGAGDKSIVLTSDAKTAGPRFRLTYELKESGLLDVKFEIAPPGKPNEFKPYMAGQARRKSK